MTRGSKLEVRKKLGHSTSIKAGKVVVTKTENLLETDPFTHLGAKWWTSTATYMQT